MVTNLSDPLTNAQTRNNISACPFSLNHPLQNTQIYIIDLKAAVRQIIEAPVPKDKL